MVAGINLFINVLPVKLKIQKKVEETFCIALLKMKIEVSVDQQYLQNLTVMSQAFVENY